ncbi:hypothetical protein LZ575_15385 [Antarcticibacterium sp. 1MA-6-2]|uniref:hypothetical protein n=1 Tax=Antarcticibacterium sp. 1MA-6-2 TaxID=2908210 RepID=UPI001F421883|nr:hypothetical protein [Antarcticibacterium sp. 1MA-6-2]UJH90248.1 hypothetical protein LZ575_15385 [Antarcticibacterium sp. 1MA-6-2]
MEEKKHIDRLFQEKFKDFEAAPREAVWNNISSRLQEKKRKKYAIPLWYRMAGIAAVLALLVNFANDLFKTSRSSNNTASITTKQQRNFGELTLISNSYNENMTRSAIILQALMQDTKNRQKQEAFEASLSTQSFSGGSQLAQQRETISAKNLKPGLSSFSILSALTYEELQQENEVKQVTEIRKIALPTPPENGFTEELKGKHAMPKRSLGFQQWLHLFTLTIWAMETL